MPDTQALEALLVRVEGATGPDREIDWQIVNLIHGSAEAAAYMHYDIGMHRYTTSIDAIVALIAKDSRGVGSVEFGPGPCEAWITCRDAAGDGWQEQAKAATPALALCAAFLRAKLAIERQP